MGEIRRKQEKAKMNRRTEIINGVLYRPSIWEIQKGNIVEVWDDFHNLYTATILLILSIPDKRVLINNGKFQEWVALNKIYKVVR